MESSTPTFYSANSEESEQFYSQESTPDDILNEMEEYEKEVERKRKEMGEKLKKKLEKEKQQRIKNKDVFWDLSILPQYNYFPKFLENIGIVDVGVKRKTISLNYNLAQGGKLGASLNASLMAQNDNYTTIVLLLPQLTHENQFKSRVLTYNNKTIDEMTELANVDKIDQLNCISFPFDLLQNCKTVIYDGNVREYKVDFTELERLGKRRRAVNKFLSYVKGRVNGTVFTISTFERLDLLEKIVSHYNPKKIQLIIDEADTLFSMTEEKNRKFTLPLSKIYHHSELVNLFTATPLKICYDSLTSYGNEIDVNVVMLPRLDIHVSTKDYEFDTLLFKDRTRLSKSSQTLGGDLPELEDFIREFIKIPNYVHEQEDEAGLPIIEMKRNICLVNVSNLKKHHNEIFNMICEIGNERYTIVDWDGDGMKVYFSYEKIHNKKHHTDLVLNGHRFENIHKGHYFLPKATEKGVMIEDILYFINTSTYQSLHGNVIVDTGKYADRGINFVSSDFNSHITHQVYLPSKSSDAACIIQAMNRLNGNFKDKGCYKPTVYTNEHGKTAALYGSEKIEHLMNECSRPNLTIEEYNDLVNTVSERENINFSEVKFPKILKTKVPEYTKGTQKKKISKKQFCHDGKSEVNTKFETDCEEVYTKHIGLYVDADVDNKFEKQGECYDQFVEVNYTEEEKKELIKKRKIIRRKRKVTIIEEEEEEEEEKIIDDKKEEWRQVIVKKLKPTSLKYYNKIIDFCKGKSILSKSEVFKNVFGDKNNSCMNTSWIWHTDTTYYKKASIDSKGLLFYQNKDGKWMMIYKN